MFITRDALPRRTMLRGMGAMVALPLLDAMVPALTALARTPAKPVRRIGFVYIPNGAAMDSWTPVEEGEGFAFSPTLQPLEPLRDRVVVLSNLGHANAESENDGAGEHARSSAVYLTGVRARKTAGVEVRAGTTVDQLIAREIGQDTPLASLELALDSAEFVGDCDAGYSCAYVNTISWRSPTLPLPMEMNPRVVFERLFGDGASAEERSRINRENAASWTRSAGRWGASRSGSVRATGASWTSIWTAFGTSNGASSWWRAATGRIRCSRRRLRSACRRASTST